MDMVAILFNGGEPFEKQNKTKQKKKKKKTKKKKKKKKTTINAPSKEGPVWNQVKTCPVAVIDYTIIYTNISQGQG